MESDLINRECCVNVVIVDGTMLVRERLKTLLRLNVPQADVIGEAADAQVAIQLIYDTHPDVIVLDLQLSGGSGFDVLRAVKLGPNAPIVIVLTNLTAPEYRIACLEAGAEFILDKSFGLDQFADILRHQARRLRCKPDKQDRP
jgi:DNA-binding NarL/FixJ family response regulator